MTGVNERLRNQTRPVWDADGTSEQFTNISATLGSGLVIPDGCTGITIFSRSPGDTDEVLVYPVGGVIGAATANNSGILLTDALQDFTAAGCSIGDRVRNLTDGSVGIVTAVGTTTLTIAADLSGGDNNDWERIIDIYRVETIAGPRLVIEGGTSTDRGRYFPLDGSWGGVGKSFYLLSSGGTADADVFYHFD